jgi:formylmethanofuran:tetrahydromethanopterin formyltransferase
MYDEVHRVPDVQTDETVRAFSGTSRRILGGVDISFADPLTASFTAADAALVDIRNLHASIFRFGGAAALGGGGNKTLSGTISIWVKLAKMSLQWP